MDDIDVRIVAIGQLIACLEANRWKDTLAARKREEKAMRACLMDILGRRPTEEEMDVAFDRQPVT